jgi:hypothetical protein
MRGVAFGGRGLIRGGQSAIVTFIGQMFYLSQSEISFHIITVESNFGVGTVQTISFAENMPPSNSFLNKFTCFKKLPN